MSTSVIQWATGHVGLTALRGIIRRPDLDLIGVRVYSESKDGTDAGALCGVPDTGVNATRDVDALLSLGADCVCYTATETAGIEPVVDDFVRILESGTNIVSSTLLPLVFPPSMPEIMDGVADRLQEAASKGRSTLFVTGVNPGHLLDILPPFLASGCVEIESISVSEHYTDISSYQQGTLARDMFGISLAPEEQQELVEFRLSVMKEYFGSALKLLALGLGGEASPIEVSLTSYLAEEEFDLPGLNVPAQSVGAVWAQLDSRVGDTELTYHELISGHPSVPRPGWPEPPAGGGGYQIEIVAEPNMQLEITFQGDEHPMAEAFVYTSNRLVNAIPSVVAAEPGFMSFLDIGRAVTARARSGQ